MRLAIGAARIDLMAGEFEPRALYTMLQSVSIACHVIVRTFDQVWRRAFDQVQRRKHAFDSGGLILFQAATVFIQHLHCIALRCVALHD